MTCPHRDSQSLAGAVHNADRGQVPVLIFSGSSPFTANGELRGSKNEFIMWIQGSGVLCISLRPTFDDLCPTDVPDQPAIVRQYMRYTAQIQSGKNASKIILRALQMYVRQPHLHDGSP